MLSRGTQGVDRDGGRLRPTGRVGVYDSDGLRDTLAERGAIANIRLMPTHKGLPAFDAKLYKRRYQVERFFSKLKHFRAVATRYGKRNDNLLASVQLASGCGLLSRQPGLLRGGDYKVVEITAENTSEKRFRREQR